MKSALPAPQPPTPSASTPRWATVVRVTIGVVVVMRFRAHEAALVTLL